MDRRLFLRDATLSCLALAGSTAPGARLTAQSSTFSHAGRIDVHHH
jgi:hypothetical protein